MMRTVKHHRAWIAVGAVLAAITAAGCGMTGYIVGGAAGATLLGGYSPSQEIEQSYYLGTFDPTEQLPAEFYRVTVRGQASLISLMRFGSGWVRADILDSLQTRVDFGNEGGVAVADGRGENPGASFETGRRLVLFGPEGFREAPKDHRLVIVMGSSPEKFFQAMDESLSTISRVMEVQRDSQASQVIFEEYVRVSGELDSLRELQREAEVGIPAPTAAAVVGGE